MVKRNSSLGVLISTLVFFFAGLWLIFEGKALLENKEKVQYPVATTLLYRYLKRIVSHIVNASTALIMPTDKIDYLDE